MYKHFVIMMTSEWPLGAVDQSRPVFFHLLVHVGDGGDDVSGQMVNVRQEGRHVPLSPDAVH